jgi:hypothetical protein
METYATNNNGSYLNSSASALNSITPALNITSSTTQPYLSTAGGTATSYSIVAVSPTDSAQFTLSNTNGTESFACSPAGTGACSSASTW